MSSNLVLTVHSINGHDCVNSPKSMSYYWWVLCLFFFFFLVMLCLFFKWWMFSNLILLSKGTTFGLGHESDTGRWELPNKFAYFISILVLRVWKSKFSGYYGVTVCHKKKRDDNGIQCFPYNYYTMRCQSATQARPKRSSDIIYVAKYLARISVPPSTWRPPQTERKLRKFYSLLSF